MPDVLSVLANAKIHLFVLLYFSGVSFDFNAIGLAWIYTMCDYTYSCGFTAVSIGNITTLLSHLYAHRSYDFKSDICFLEINEESHVQR